MCVKARSFKPLAVNLDLLRAPVKALGVGWWEAVVLTTEGDLWAWNFFEHR